jgi:hypothetical protein
MAHGLLEVNKAVSSVRSLAGHVLDLAAGYSHPVFVGMTGKDPGQLGRLHHQFKEFDRSGVLKKSLRIIFLFFKIPNGYIFFLNEKSVRLL